MSTEKFTKFFTSQIGLIITQIYEKFNKFFYEYRICCENIVSKTLLKTKNNN